MASMATNDSTPNKIIFSMHKVSRVHPPKRQVLKDISLGFYYGAKIGVLGLNGAGKSSLLRIIAGKDDGYSGDVHFTGGQSIGFLEQEPKLDPKKTVKESVSEGVGEVVAALKEFEEINNSFANPMSDDEMEKLLARQARVQEKLDSMNAWELDSRLELAMDALRCPPDDALIEKLSGGEKRRVALCRLLLKEAAVASQ